MQNQHARSRRIVQLLPGQLDLLHLAQHAAAKVLNGIMRGWGPAKSPCGGGSAGGAGCGAFPSRSGRSLFSSKNKLGDGGGRDGGRFRGRRFGAIGLPTYIILEPNTLRQPPPGPTAKG